jgi:SAM-dependent methyltransferase
MLRKLYFRLSPKGRRIARRIYFFPHDLIHRSFRKSDYLVPPKGMTFVGSGNFELMGDKFFKHIVETTQIKSDSSILDIGSGIGRIARPFSKYLDKKGEYIGFDIIDYGIKWCKKKYQKFSNFRFDFYPLKNDLYNLSAQASAAEFVFPYPKEKFDLVILVSVFTHMQKDEVENYFYQISSVLKKDSFCYASFFILERGKKSEFFSYDFGDYHLHDLKVKNANVAYDMDFILSTASRCGLTLQKYFPGWWISGYKPDTCDFQDIVIFKKI